MMKVRIALVICLFWVAAGLSAQPAEKLEELLRRSGDSLLLDVMRQPLQYQLQLIYSPVERDAAGKPSVTSYTYGLDTVLYWYPAQTVHLPLVALSLEKLNGLRIVGLDKYSPLSVGEPGQRVQSPGSVAQCIQELLSSGTESAYDPLYAFLGQGAVQQRLQELGYEDIRIGHRVRGAQPGMTQPVSFRSGDSLLYYQGRMYDSLQYRLPLKEQLRGVAYIDERGQRQPRPFDFRYEHFIGLPQLHDMLRAIFLTSGVPASRRFRLSPADHRFLRGQLANGLPSKHRVLPGPARRYGISGRGYGFLTEVAYVLDPDSGVEFLMAVSLQLNRNQVYGDGIYEYESIGRPVLATLYRLLYAHASRR
ncbi:MAG: hypothetical protein GVY26_00875 [Bacteroidetes bacterium]|nr:hypothetical protein [Bacteroidota bacterium]